MLESLMSQRNQYDQKITFSFKDQICNSYMCRFVSFFNRGDPKGSHPSLVLKQIQCQAPVLSIFLKTRKGLPFLSQNLICYYQENLAMHCFLKTLTRPLTGDGKLQFGSRFGISKKKSQFFLHYYEILTTPHNESATVEVRQLESYKFSVNIGAIHI